MSRLQIIRADRVQRTMDQLYDDLAHRNAAAPEGNCAVEQTAALAGLCLSQSCGKCVPCRVGLDRMRRLMEKILAGEGAMQDLEVLERTARVTMDSSDCAIGGEAGRAVLNALQGAREDFVSHIQKQRRGTDRAAADPQPV